MKDYVAGLVGHMRMSYLTVWNLGLPTTIVAEFRRRYPAVKLETTTGYSQSNVQRVMAGEVDFAFVGLPVSGGPRVVLRPIERQEVVLVMTPANHLAGMTSIPVECLRGEPMIVVSSALQSPHVAASRRWLVGHLGQEPNVVAEEPVDQIAAAVALSGLAVTFTTASRAALWEAEGLISRRLAPIPLIEYGVAYLQDNVSPALRNMVGIVDEASSAFPHALPVGSELVWTQ
jgi:DNA-binding transcriptional LysR family regulator